MARPEGVPELAARLPGTVPIGFFTLIRRQESGDKTNQRTDKRNNAPSYSACRKKKKGVARQSGFRVKPRQKFEEARTAKAHFHLQIFYSNHVSDRFSLAMKNFFFFKGQLDEGYRKGGFATFCSPAKRTNEADAKTHLFTSAATAGRPNPSVACAHVACQPPCACFFLQGWAAKPTGCVIVLCFVCVSLLVYVVARFYVTHARRAATNSPG